MKTQISTDNDVLQCDNICNCLCTGACGDISDLILIAGDALETVKFHLLAHYLLPSLCTTGDVP